MNKFLKSNSKYLKSLSPKSFDIPLETKESLNRLKGGINYDNIVKFIENTPDMPNHIKAIALGNAIVESKVTPNLKQVGGSGMGVWQYDKTRRKEMLDSTKQIKDPMVKESKHINDLYKNQLIKHNSNFITKGIGTGFKSYKDTQRQIYDPLVPLTFEKGFERIFNGFTKGVVRPAVKTADYESRKKASKLIYETLNN